MKGGLVEMYVSKVGNKKIFHPQPRSATNRLLAAQNHYKTQHKITDN
jgi:hypothetical protein